MQICLPNGIFNFLNFFFAQFLCGFQLCNSHCFNACICCCRYFFIDSVLLNVETALQALDPIICNALCITNAREAAAASKRKDKLTKQLKECRDYDEKISHLALSRIALDLDDGVKVNYRKLQTAADGKFYEVLADSKNIMAKEKNIK